MLRVWTLLSGIGASPEKVEIIRVGFTYREEKQRIRKILKVRDCKNYK